MDIFFDKCAIEPFKEEVGEEMGEEETKAIEEK
jgi:hypothetical protein